MIGNRRAGWDKALDLVAKRFRQTIAKHGPDSVAFYVSGQLLTEDYYVANKLMKGFIGSANIDTNSRLCMSSAVAGHQRAFGEDIVPASYDDLVEADLVVLVGSNTAWCHPIVYQRIMAARATRGTKLVVIDPRRTETCEEADLHLPLKPGTDVALMNGLLAHLHREGLVDEAYLAAHVATPEGFWDALDTDHDLWSIARTCDLPPADLQRFYDLFAATPRTVTLFSQGINQSIRGTDQVNAIINVHLATGRIGKPGAAPFSITGQPNAMGGREVGGLASTLAAHRGFGDEDIADVGRFWAAERMATKPGLKAVDMFRAIGEGRVKALWVMATNPAVSLPDAGRVREALAGCPFVVVSDVMADTDTGRFAHVRLPAAAWGEKDGTVTNSERLVSRQRAVLPLPGEAKPDWWIVKEVGRRMGWRTAFGYERPADIWREHARLTAYRNGGARLLDLREHAAIGNEVYDAMAPFMWGGTPFANGRFPTPDGKARLVSVAQRAAEATLADWPMTLNTGRYRDQWHTMTRTGLSPKLARHREEPLVEIHPDDAAALGLADHALARVSTPQGASLFRVAHAPGQRRGDLFAPIHWTDRQSTGGRTGLLPDGPAIDGWAHWPPAASARRSPFGPAGLQDDARAGRAGHHRLAWLPDLAWRDGGRAALPLGDARGCPRRRAVRARRAGRCCWPRRHLTPKGARIEASDPARGTRRTAILRDGRLIAALFVTKTRGVALARLARLPAGAAAGPARARRRAPGAQQDRGAIVCACFDVGMRTIVAAIRDQGLADVAAIGAALGAGTNCGSCRPALAQLIAAQRKEAVHG